MVIWVLILEWRHATFYVVRWEAEIETGKTLAKWEFLLTSSSLTAAGHLIVSRWVLQVRTEYPSKCHIEYGFPRHILRFWYTAERFFAQHYSTWYSTSVPGTIIDSWCVAGSFLNLVFPTYGRLYPCCINWRSSTTGRAFRKYATQRVGRKRRLSACLYNRCKWYNILYQIYIIFMIDVADMALFPRKTVMWFLSTRGM